MQAGERSKAAADAEREPAKPVCDLYLPAADSNHEVRLSSLQPAWFKVLELRLSQHELKLCHGWVSPPHHMPKLLHSDQFSIRNLDLSVGGILVRHITIMLTMDDERGGFDLVER